MTAQELLLKELLALTNDMHDLKEVMKDDRKERAERAQKQIQRERHLQKSITDMQKKKIQKLKEENENEIKEKNDYMEKYNEENQQKNKLDEDFQNEKAAKEQLIAQLDETNDLRLKAQASFEDNQIESQKLQFENESQTRQNELLQKKTEDQEKEITDKDGILKSKTEEVNGLQKTVETKDQLLEDTNKRYVEESFKCGQMKAQLDDMTIQKNRMDRLYNIEKCDENIISSDLEQTTTKLAETQENLGKEKTKNQTLITKTQKNQEQINDLAEKSKDMYYYKHKEYDYKETTYRDNEDITEPRHFLFISWRSKVGYKSHRLTIKERRLFLGYDNDGKPKYGEWEVYHHEVYDYREGS